MTHHDDADAARQVEPLGGGVAALLAPLDGAAGPALPIDDGRASALVAGALIGWGGPAGATHSTPPPPPAVAPGSTSLLVRTLPWGAGVGVAALAALGAWTLLGPTAPDAASSAPAAPVAPPPRVTGDAVDPAPPRPGDHGAWVVGEPARGDAQATRPELGDAADTPRRSGSTVGGHENAGDLLARANQLRAQGRFRRAESVYRAAARAGRGSLTAYVAQVAAGGIRLDHLNDPRGARDAYLAARRAQPGGPLDVEVQQGLATAARQLGDVAGERRALRALLASTSGGPVAERARMRLAELAGNRP